MFSYFLLICRHILAGVVLKGLFDVMDQLIGPLNLHLSSLLSVPISEMDDERAHFETKKVYLALLNNIMAGDLQGIFTSECKL